MGQREYRHATYFAVQAMEKYVRSEIFKRVNAMNEYYQARTRTHDLDVLLIFLVEIASADETAQAAVRSQLHEHVLENARFGELHNDLRYPMFRRRRNDYGVLVIDADAAAFVLAKLDALKGFMAAMHRLT